MNSVTVFVASLCLVMAACGTSNQTAQLKGDTITGFATSSLAEQMAGRWHKDFAFGCSVTVWVDRSDTPNTVTLKYTKAFCGGLSITSGEYTAVELRSVDEGTSFSMVTEDGIILGAADGTYTAFQLVRTGPDTGKLSLAFGQWTRDGDTIAYEQTDGAYRLAKQAQ